MTKTTISVEHQKMVPLAILKKVLPAEKIDEIESLLEDFEAAQSPHFQNLVKKAQKSFKKNGAISSEEFFLQFEK